MKTKKTARREARHIRLTRVLLWRLIRRHQVRERIEQANQWALRHKRRTAAITVGLPKREYTSESVGSSNTLAISSAVS